MPDPKRANHWADLASEVGADIAPDGGAQQPVAEQSSPVAQQQPSPSQAAAAPRATKPAAPRPRPAANWDHLADELGVPVVRAPVPKPEPVVVRAPVAKPAPAVVRAEPVAVKVQPAVENAAAPQISLPSEDAIPTPSEIWESQMDELADPVFLDSHPAVVADNDSDEHSLPMAEADDTPKRSRSGSRRRRGRRRGRGGRQEGAAPAEASVNAEATGSAESDASSENEAETHDALGPATADDNETTQHEPAAAESDRPSGRGRRRRRHRGGRRRTETAVAPSGDTSHEPIVGDEISAADEDQPHDAPAASEVIALDRESPEHDEEGWDAGDESEEEGLEGEGEGDEDGDGKPGKLSHRAIPTWEQAIGLMVATNMESRAKNPGAGKPRGRGRRGPRDRPRRN